MELRGNWGFEGWYPLAFTGGFGLELLVDEEAGFVELRAGEALELPFTLLVPPPWLVGTTDTIVRANNTTRDQANQSRRRQSLRYGDKGYKSRLRSSRVHRMWVSRGLEMWMRERVAENGYRLNETQVAISPR